MREYSLPPLVDPVYEGGLADSVYETAAREPGLPQLARREEGAGGLRDGAWRPMTAAAFRNEVLALAKGLLADGIRFGEPVAVMARTSYEWTLFSYALWSVGARVVTVYPTSSPDQVRRILASSGACAIVVENEQHAMTLGSACGTLPSLRRVWQLDTGCVAKLTSAGTPVADEEVHRHRRAVTPDSTAALIYTSGTTGPPRGCVITHANLAVECDTLLKGWRQLMAEPGEQPAILAFLPMCHVYGLMVSVLCLRGGVLLGHQSDPAPEALLPALASFRPTCVFAVPYIFERIFARARRAAEEQGRLRLFEQAVRTAEQYAEAAEQRALGTGPGPGPALRVRRALADRLVYRRIRAVLGGRTRNVVSGGSTLSRELGLVFSGAGITVYDGYGLTETTAAVTAQPPERPRFGTVGRPLPGTSLHIARDGEVWVRGRTICAGYVAGAADEGPRPDGWLATGDVGYLDDGYLVITGRKKDVIVTSGGETVAPLVLEERLRAHPLVSQALVVGEDRPYIAALVTLDPDALEHWQRYGRTGRGSGYGQGNVHGRSIGEELRREIDRAVAAANSAVSRAESIRAFRILSEEFSVDNGMMTPSLKLRRGAIVRMYAAEIDELYA
ncbi:long-chain fatty acid--CoA ligase [Streptomyces armeniacus]|uniref:Acyl-CoA synthetase n=1 Tax=Streptomyces armeniacus TaxID=83291 RepID=A0A345XNX9_9ACTN|nr:AMP-dependent synthetase/ligase [Streptomyces armeniacus]AXK33345.1 long-chain fatty acid--CoA ligase [Streptomyces armeniacus]